jgi:hypothetical protein
MKMNSAKKMMLGMLWAKVGAKGLCPNNARPTPEQLQGKNDQKRKNI